MKFKNNLLLAFALGVLSLTFMPHTTFVMDAPTEISQEQMDILMKQMYELIMPEYKKIYKKHFEAIEWVGYHYCTDVEKGNTIILMISQEFQAVLENNIDAIIDRVFASSLPKALFEDPLFKINFKNMWLRMVPQMVTQSLRRDAELKSSVYHELCDARK